MMPEDDVKTLLEFAGRLADAAASETLRHFRQRTPVDDKAGSGKLDPVTEADRGAERAIRARIEATYPDHGIVGEEFAPRPAKGRFEWIVDPVDGTRAYVTGLPLWGTLIGLERDGVLLIGLMDQPYMGERFTGGPGGAFLTRQGRTARLSTSGVTSLAGASLGATTPEMFDGETEKAFARVADRARLLRFGGDCYLYAMVAAGHLDLVVEAGLKRFDIAALVPIVEAAGGVVTDWSGGPARLGGRIVAAATQALHREALGALSGRA